jgi:hypothetical protein
VTTTRASIDRRWTACLGLALALLGRTTVDVHAQTAAAPALKAAFVFNFARFSEWPADALPPQSPLTLCVVGDDDVERALAQTVKGQVVADHPVVVVRREPDAVGRSCNLVYASKLNRHQYSQLIDASRNALLLTVSDTTRFAADGGMAELYLEDGKMRFAVNLDAVQRSRLRMSSRLLTLAKLVRDE